MNIAAVFCLLCISVVVALPGSTAWAQLPLSAHNTPVLVSFPAFDGSGFAPTPGPGQLDSDHIAILGLSDGDLLFGDTGTTGDYARTRASGGVTTGGVYSFETDSGDYALGIQPTGTDFTPGAIIVRYVNQTGSSIDDANVEYDVKVYNDQDRSSTLSLSYASSPSCTADPGSLVFTDVPSTSYTSPETSDLPPAWQSVYHGVYLPALALPDAHCLYLQFTSDDSGGSGSRDQLALDNLAVTTNPNTPLPVELTSFTALTDGAEVILLWETASETNNAGFEVQYYEEVHPYASDGPGVRAYHETPQLTPQSSWHRLALIEGAGTTLAPQSYTYRTPTLAPGRYIFRLKQMDYDGTFTYSPHMEILIGMSTAYHLSKPSPNPFRAKTSFSLSVFHAQRVAVRVYDLLGRLVADLHDGYLEADATRTFTFEAGALPSGLYLIRIQGERFAIGQAALLTR